MTDLRDPPRHLPPRTARQRPRPVRLVTVSGHPMPCDRLDADRRYCEAVDDFFADLTAGEAS